MGKLFFSPSSSSDLQIQQVPLPRPVPTEVVATRAGPRDSLRRDRDLSLILPKTPGQLGTGQHPEKIGPLCLQEPQPQAPMSHTLSKNVYLQLHLPLLGLWQENPSQGMSHHLCRESLPWLLPKTQTPTMTDRDIEPFLATLHPGAQSALQSPPLYVPRGCHQLSPHPGEIEFPSPEGLFNWFVCSLLVIFFYGFMYFFLLSFC